MLFSQSASQELGAQQPIGEVSVTERAGLNTAIDLVGMFVLWPV